MSGRFMPNCRESSGEDSYAAAATVVGSVDGATVVFRIRSSSAHGRVCPSGRAEALLQDCGRNIVP